ncbi:MAG: 23S rRNA (uracil(1939)-C(5))-methyltransferase RlmD [archaeon]
MATPLCTYFGKCGGCSAQHIDYSLQLENKRRVIQHNIQFGDIKIVNGLEYGYRNRMDLLFYANGLGFREKSKWHSIIDVEKCVIANKRINYHIEEVRSFFRNSDYYDLRKKTGTFKFAVIRAPRERSSVSILLNEESSRLAEAIDKIKEYAKITSADHVSVAYQPAGSEISTSDNFFMVKGEPMLTETYLRKKFYFSVQGFFQNNTEMAEKMLVHVNNLLKKQDTIDAGLLDLYSGVGTFGITNADLFKSVTMVENFKSSIDAANMNIKENNIKNASAIVLDARNIRKVKLADPLYVITDPPRSGMDIKTILWLKEFMPEKIIYISCNPEQLGKELKRLKSYKIKSAAIFDMFPQTPHIEAVVELVKDNQTL